MPRDFLILCDTDGNQVKRITLEMLSKANALAQGGATNVVVLGDVGDNFAAGMTGGIAFIYDKTKEFEKKVNNDSVVWQNVETEYWKSFLRNLVLEHHNETRSILSGDIIENFDDEIKNFVQVCPKEMLNKLKNPITLKNNIKAVS